MGFACQNVFFQIKTLGEPSGGRWANRTWWRENIQWAALDLFGAYRAAYNQALPQAVQIADPFHGRTLRNWHQQIVARHHADISNGSTESVNDLVKRIKRVAFGFATIEPASFSTQENQPEPAHQLQLPLKFEGPLKGLQARCVSAKLQVRAFFGFCGGFAVYAGTHLVRIMRSYDYFGSTYRRKPRYVLYRHCPAAGGGCRVLRRAERRVVRQVGVRRGHERDRRGSGLCWGAHCDAGRTRPADG